MKKIFLLLFLLLPLQSHSAVITDYSPISHWSLDETSGVRYDSSTTSNDLSDNNTVLYATGKLDNAGDFELSNSEWLSITDASQTSLEPSTAFSVSGWYKFESILPNTNDQMEMFSKVAQGSGSNLSYTIFS
jgi:hypothetical protein